MVNTAANVYKKTQLSKCATESDNPQGGNDEKNRELFGIEFYLRYLCRNFLIQMKKTM